MANPQKENGSTDIANELLEAIYSSNFNGTEYAILLCVLRYTYGFHRKEHSLSINFIAKATNKHKINISNTINNLIKNNVLIETKKPSFNSVREVGINKDYSKWNDYQLAKRLTVNENTNATVSELTNRGVSELTNQETKNKTKNKETKNILVEKPQISKIYFNDFEINNLFLEFLDLRKKLKCKNTDRAINLLLNKLDEYNDSEKIEMLNNAIMNSWKSVYPIKNFNKNEKKGKTLVMDEVLKEMYDGTIKF